MTSFNVVFAGTMLALIIACVALLTTAQEYEKTLNTFKAAAVAHGCATFAVTDTSTGKVELQWK